MGSITVPWGWSRHVNCPKALRKKKKVETFCSAFFQIITGFTTEPSQNCNKLMKQRDWNSESANIYMPVTSQVPMRALPGSCKPPNKE